MALTVDKGSLDKMEVMRCSKCGCTFNKADAPPSQRDKASYYCKDCRRVIRKKYYWDNVDYERRQSKENQRKTRLVRVYGITEEDYANLLDEQNGSCAICKNSSSRLVIDHDHESGKVRALLCDTCNRGIGLLKDNFEVVQKAADYLRKFSTTETTV